MSDMAIGDNKVTLRSCIDHANRTRIHLDAFSKPDKYTIKHYLAHLQDCHDCPTLGFLSKKDYYNLSSINFPSQYVRNKILIESKPEIIAMKAKIHARLSELYPRTKYIRQYIIENDRLSLYYIKQSAVFSYWDKFKIGAKIFLKNLLKGKCIL